MSRRWESHGWLLWSRPGYEHPPGHLWVMVQRDCQQGTGPFEVTLTSAGKEIKQLPPALTDVLGIKSPWGKCLGLNLGYHRQGKHLGGSKPIPTLADKLGHAAGGCWCNPLPPPIPHGDGPTSPAASSCSTPLLSPPPLGPSQPYSLLCRTATYPGSSPIHLCS